MPLNCESSEGLQGVKGEYRTQKRMSRRLEDASRTFNRSMPTVFGLKCAILCRFPEVYPDPKGSARVRQVSCGRAVRLLPQLQCRRAPLGFALVKNTHHAIEAS